MDPEQLARAADQADEALAAQTNDYPLQAAIADYQNRERRFGKTSEQVAGPQS